MLEAELVAAGLLARQVDSAGRDTLRVTDAGVAQIALSVQQHRGARAAHEALVARVAAEMQRAGRLVWRGLSLRAAVASDEGAVDWVMAMPDVFSIRHTTVEDYVEPIVHEIKVRRADLLADLRKPAKREAYLALASQCWYVLEAGIGDGNEVPPDCGVMAARDGALEVVRPAPRRAMRLSLGTWMAVARATPLPLLDLEAQGLLRDADLPGGAGGPRAHG